MIGTFWNICRACPSMPVDKLHSEYRSTYHWHEYKSAKHEVIEKPPQSNFGKDYDEVKMDNNSTKGGGGGGGGGGELEPSLSRKKKNPNYSYRAHSFLKSPSSSPRHASTSLDRARCSERDGSSSSRRSKSAGPQPAPSSPHYRLLRSDSDPSDFYQQLAAQGEETKCPGKISTEYRLQFAWPGVGCRTVEPPPQPSKSLSMGTIKSSANPGHANLLQPTPVHNTHPPHTATVINDTEPLVNGDLLALLKKEDHMRLEQIQKNDYVKPIFSWNEFNTEYKKKFRPFSQYDYIEGVFKPKRDAEEIIPEIGSNETWFREVLELRKKAGEYKHRGWGTELVPEHLAEVYSKQICLWEQVARRSSLEALSLASSAHRKDDNELAKKSLPSRALWVELEGGKNEANKNRMENFLKYNLDRAALNSGCKSSRGLAGGPDVFKHIVKSPPEPTRVKSPEQILLRSPEPVNWTVPLDTGKTFTVTQNVSQGSPLPPSSYATL